MKASYKMRKAISRLLAKFGDLSIRYDVERDKNNRVGRGFYDFAVLHCPILQRTWIVNHFGEVW